MQAYLIKNFSMADLVFKKGKIVFPDGVREGDVVVERGIIVDIENDYKGDAQRTIDCAGKFVFPGVIDAHVHMRVPGMEYKEDFATGSMAAIAGGVTSFFDMPNTIPPTITKKSLLEKRALIGDQSFANYGFFFGATDDNFEELKRVSNIPGVKAYMGESTGGLIVRTDEALENFFSYRKFPIVVHAESQECLDRFAAELEGESARLRPEYHSLVRPSECAREAVKHVLHLAKKFNGRVHVAHVSTREELEVLSKFKSESVTCEVTPHHLIFDIGTYVQQGGKVKVNPPLRTTDDREALWQALRDGLIDVIASDHAPHSLSEKEAEYKGCPSGVPGVEFMLPLMLDAANKGLINLDQLARLMAANPAKIFGVTDRGRIEKGLVADLVVIDMEKEVEISREMVKSKCGWSPYEGMKLKGWPVVTVLGGEVVFEEGRFVAAKRGRELNFLQ